MSVVVDYLKPNVPSGLPRTPIKIIEGTNESLKGFGYVFDDPAQVEIEIVRWPAQGWRPVDLDSGDEGGTKQGVFVSEWKGDVLYGRNEAVGGHYILGYGCDPGTATEDHDRAASSVLLWHANYHPDGGQSFFPLDNQPFVVPLALPGDDVTPDQFVCFYFHGDKGLYIHPNVWHDGVFTCRGKQRFQDKQGAVHARVSVNFATEFQCLVEAPLTLK